MTKPCPWCGKPPAFVTRPNKAGSEERSLRCSETACPIKPGTKWRPTEAWRMGVGYRPVSHDVAALAEWNARAVDTVKLCE